MHPRTRLVYFYFFRVNFLVKALTSGRCDQVWLPWQRCICRSRYGCFCLSPQVTYLHTKIEGGLKFFISNFASLSWRIALKNMKQRGDDYESTLSLLNVQNGHLLLPLCCVLRILDLRILRVNFGLFLGHHSLVDGV